jgi:hypothetical protein
MRRIEMTHFEYMTQVMKPTDGRLSKSWKDTVDDAITNKDWDLYDQLIQKEVADYNKRLTGSPGYSPVDWLLVKAIVWVESGGPKTRAWKGRVMQIGNLGDKGYTALKNGVVGRYARSEGSELIISPELCTDIVRNVPINTPATNIRAGIAYLFTRMATTTYKTFEDGPIETTSLRQNENFAVVANRVGSTTEVIVRLNNHLNPKRLPPGIDIKYRKARVERIISAWKSFTVENIADLYNVGDELYADKLNYVLGLFKRLKRER